MKQHVHALHVYILITNLQLHVERMCRVHSRSVYPVAEFGLAGCFVSFFDGSELAVA